jgi:rhodanese-related sulfurtransferase
VARQLIEWGFTKVYALKGGWNAWEKAGYPTEPK